MKKSILGRNTQLWSREVSPQQSTKLPAPGIHVTELPTGFEKRNEVSVIIVWESANTGRK